MFSQTYLVGIKSIQSDTSGNQILFNQDATGKVS